MEIRREKGARPVERMLFFDENVFRCVKLSKEQKCASQKSLVPQSSGTIASERKK